MVRHTVDYHGHATLLTNDPTNICMQMGCDLWLDALFTLLGGEDYVESKI